jgi:uncharacterized protein
MAFSKCVATFSSEVISMLLIAHYIDKSRIHGLGVFALDRVARGQKIWEFNPLVDIVIPLVKLKSLPSHVAQRIQRHAEFYPEEGLFILGADGDSFMNHSANPNLINLNKLGYANCDIEIDDEITCDYRSTKMMDSQSFL